MSHRGWQSAAAGLLVLWLVLPLVPLVIWSFARGWRFPDLWPAQTTLRVWADVLAPSGDLWPALAVTTGIAGVVTALSLVIGLPAARVLALGRLRGKGAVEMLILAPIIVPGIAVVLGLHDVFLRLGLTNTALGVILAHLVPVLPYTVLVLASVFRALPQDLEAAARTLGAGRGAVFWHVTLPAIAPGVAVAALFAFLVSWSQYVLTLVIGGGRVVTLPLLLFGYATSGRNDLTGAIGVVYVLPGLIVLALAARRLGAVGRPGVGRV